MAKERRLVLPERPNVNEFRSRRIAEPISTAVLLGIVLAFLPRVHAESIWIEGEQPEASDVRHHGWYDGVDADLLSGGDWLSHFGGQVATASYNVRVTKPATYTVWARINPTKSSLAIAWDDQAWQSIPTRNAKHVVNVAKDGAVDLRFVGWLRLGQRSLAKGTSTLRFRFDSKNQNHGAIDAIFLTDEGLSPVGKGNPAEEGQLHHPGYFAWSPGTDPLREDSPIDLRRLNETVAGESGFVRRDGDRFVTGADEPIRFWAVQNGLGKDPAQYERRARRLAKYGVNLVRMGSGEFFRVWRQNPDQMRALVDDLHLRVAALRKAGIYTYIDHLYWHTHHPIREADFPGFGEGKNAIALMFFKNQFQDAYRQFLIDFMHTPNRHTGLSMADDPAVAFLEIQNESSLLFYTFNPARFPESERALVEQRFGDWLKAKYGDLASAQKSWQTSPRPNGNGLQDPRAGKPTPDQWDVGRVGLYSAGTLSGADWAVQQRNQRRASDQLQFMVESQQAFYQTMRHSLRSAGVKQMIVPSNWKTADPKVLDALERHTYTAGDVVCRNSYSGVDYAKDGQQKFYEIEVGDTYRDGSALKRPGLPAPLGTPLVKDYPFMVTENNWTRPNRYRVEWPLMIASYASLQGIDGWTFFAMEDVDWRHSMGVWDLSNPSILGQFPATALMFRRGDVRAATEPVVDESVALDDAYQMKGTAAVPLRGSDALWQARIGELEGGQPKQADGQIDQPSVDPLAYFVGPVVQSLGDGPSTLRSASLSQYIDRDQQIVRSVTGQLSWNAGVGVMTVNTPRAQGAWGFLQDAGTIRLDDVAIDSRNTYGSVLVISLDGMPLAQSAKILIQTGTWDQPYGFETESVGEYQRITKLGGYPMNVREVDATVHFKRPWKQARVLDGNGDWQDRTVPVTEMKWGRSVQLPTDAIYTVVQ
ncbi:hypothetical protein [Crateriforma spongiae]|uniref:hypothetical protein n=1 Tax=Crateriforma spongiae TaxID=2724528 RepID=UPI001445CD6B|nr:hypothetical protein [Crateriforma spongiae]